MTLADVTYLPEQPAHDPEIEAINEEAFGPGRFARAAYKIREGGPHEREPVLRRDAWRRGRRLGAHDADRGRRRPRAAARAACGAPGLQEPRHRPASWWRLRSRRRENAGAPAVILVGDEPYYGPLGFKKIPRGQISMPRPVDLDRLLAVEFAPGAVAR